MPKNTKSVKGVSVIFGDGMFEILCEDTIWNYLQALLKYKISPKTQKWTYVTPN
jgi:hypothetical protein